MKLYVMPGACSLASHIALEEASDWAAQNNLSVPDHQVVVVERGKNFDKEFLALNELGTVPLLETNAGYLIGESLAVLMHIADHHPAHVFAPKLEAQDRDQLLSLLSFMVTTAHPTFQLLWRSDRFIDTPEHRRALENKAEARLKTIFAYLDKRIHDREFLFRKGPTVADAYLFVLGRWGLRVRSVAGAFPSLRRFTETMAVRPSVVRAMKTEGIALYGPESGLG